MTPERNKLTGAPLRASEKRKLPNGPTVRSFRTEAKRHALDALESLASLAQGASSEAVRVSAANAVLDRAYGKPASGAARPGAKPADDGRDVEYEVQWLSDENS
jgi:hypothetical protein